MFGRGRVRAPISLLIAGLLGIGVLAGGQSVALGAEPAPSSTTTALSLGPVAKTTAKPPAKTAPKTTPGTSPKAQTGKPRTSGPSPSAKLPKAAALPSAADYVPAACNLANPAKGHASCQAMVKTGASHKIVPDVAGPPAGALGPEDIQSAYRLPQGGQGQTVAIVDAFGDSKAESDLAVFRAQYGLPACTTANGCFHKLDQNGGTSYPADDAGWAQETALDLDAVSSACPACSITLLEGASTSVDDLGAAVDTAAGLGLKYISNSYGIDGEDPEEATVDHYYDHPGVAVTASSGDKGNITLWPATSAHVTAVGGTTLTKSADSARGWEESAWAQGGSGCSKYEPKPSYQQGLDTNCANKGTADVSAVADPATGLGIYDSLGMNGWMTVGGTSLSSPLVAAMYALAGPPKADTYPVEYPYFNQGNGLFDVTSGSDGSCGTLLCTAGPGWDGPTGLGTPDGVGTLAYTPQGVLAGQATDQASGAPLAGLTLTATGKNTGNVYHAVTDAQGHYTLPLAADDYQLAASPYGYAPVTRSDVQVAAGQTVTADLVITKLPTHKVSGTVTDSSGHGWPLYAKITIDGYPNGALYTDPYTGAYAVDLPEQADYTLHVTPVYPGYGSSDQQVALGTADVRRDIGIGADPTACVAPGYSYPARADFEGWTGSKAQGGWTVTDDGTTGFAWEFANTVQLWNLTGGTGDFAAATPYSHLGAAEDTSLTSAAMDLTHQAAPDLTFDYAYIPDSGSAAQAQLSLDGGATWSTVWQSGADEAAGPVDVPLPQAAGHTGAKVRFHYTGAGESLWELDDVSVGSCAPVTGGLVAGVVTDGNTHAPKNDATVTDDAAPAASGVSAATAQDAGLSDGFYWLFSPSTGKRTYHATAARYATTAVSATTVADAVTKKNVVLQAGRLTVTAPPLSVDEAMGKSASKKVTLTNSGQAPLHVALGEQNTGFTAMDAPAAGAWTPMADYPEPIARNALGAYEGKVYSVGGVPANGVLPISRGYVYDPATAAWSPIAPLPQAVASPTGAFLNGTFYVVGGTTATVAELSTVYAYHPATDSWSRVADLPEGVFASTVSVLDGKLYVVGGCLGNCAQSATAAAYSFDPARNSWTRVADYPITVSQMACAGISGEIVCNGGTSPDAGNDYLTLDSTYVYHPATDTWTQGADSPYGAWGMAYSGADGKLQIAGGLIQNADSARASQYDPVTNAWSALPSAPTAFYGSGSGGCGLYQVGSAGPPRSFASVLPGYDECGGDDVSWLSEDSTGVDLAAGQSVTVGVTFDASKVAQPGGYAAALTVTTDSPYGTPPVAAALQVTAPKAWGKVSGTVTDAATGAPIAGATVQICTMYRAGLCGQVSYTLKTDSHGGYGEWLDKGYSPLFLTVAINGYQPKFQEVRIKAGATAVADFALPAI